MLLFILIISSVKGYLNNWFPLVSINSHDFKNPHQLTLLGKQFVLWKKDDKYILQNDICPHRCAPLSEGYIDKNSKNLRCAYHGWEFDDTGKCTDIPQSNLKITNKKANSQCYPTYSYGDILWGYLGSSPYDHTPDQKYYLQNSSFAFFRDLPYGVHILLENFFDPAHIPYAHHKLQSNRDKGCPIDIKLLTDINNNNSFSILFQDTNENNSAREGLMTFNYPCHYYLTQTQPKSSFLHGLHIFFVPIKEDYTRIFIKYKFNEKSRIFKIMNLIPLWYRHILTNNFLDSDSLILHKQEKNINLCDSYNSHNLYFLPTSSDKSIILYRKWIKKHFEKIPFYNKLPIKNDLTREQILDRYNQHTKNCKVCKKAYRNLQIGSYLLGLSIFIFYKKVILFPVIGIIYIFLHNLKQNLVFKDYVHNLL
jgi:phenylpropionate dioxygenase-like ring-hydroxylating dioxygenase large terminal subunit